MSQDPPASDSNQLKSHPSHHHLLHHLNLMHQAIHQTLNQTVEQVNHLATKTSQSVQEIHQQAVKGASVVNPSDVAHQASEQLRQVTDQAIAQLNELAKNPDRLIDMGSGLAGGMAGSTVGEIVGGSVGTVFGPVGVVVGAEAGGLVGQVVAGQQTSHITHHLLHPKDLEDSNLSEIADALESAGGENVGETLGGTVGGVLDATVLHGLGGIGKTIGSNVGKFAGKSAVHDHHKAQETVVEEMIEDEVEGKQISADPA